MLTQEQQKAFDIVTGDGKNLLLQGPGGGGKSYTIKQIIAWARSQGIQYGVTATTGSAAILIGGTTIHSFLGIGLGNKSPQELAEVVKTRKKFVYNRLRRLQLLIIDEISMMDATLLDVVSQFLSIIRGNNMPFGNVQIVFSGDMFQLPPVKGKFFFKSDIWTTMKNDAHIAVVELTESQRHKDDLVFMKMLMELRWGKCTPEIVETLKKTKENVFDNEIEPTLLYSRNVDVDNINQEKYEALVKSGARSFEYKLSCSSEAAKLWAQSSKIPDVCQMCIGAQVVLTWNVSLEEGLCNGSRGVVIDVGLGGVFVKFMNGKTVLISSIQVENEDCKHTWIRFMPLRLAYAITINKSQGMTLDCAIIVLDKNMAGNVDFYYGRAYTALSRVKSLQHVWIKHATMESFVAHPDVIEFYENM